MLPPNPKPLIVGAGPVGLSAALFLRRHGIDAQIIDARAEPSPFSKALAVNPRTLELLEATGITNRMLKLGRPIRHALFWQGEKQIARVSLALLRHKYPFMLALSQAVTERLIAEEFTRLGGKIERNVKLTQCTQPQATIHATIEMDGQGAIELAPPWLLAADGARSQVRQSLQIAFEGSNLPNEWFLADTRLETELEADAAHILFLDDGVFVFLLPVIDGDESAAGLAPLWRIITNRPNPLAFPFRTTHIGTPVWQSEFHIGHRIVPKMQDGNIFFAGDAAHIHSPMGARGMNLGIEDAWVFSELISERNRRITAGYAEASTAAWSNASNFLRAP